MLSPQDRQRLVAYVIAFLEEEIVESGGNSDFSESIEVAIQCLSSSYDVTTAAVGPGPGLVDIFAAGSSALGLVGVSKPASDEDKAKAEELKMRGNECMTENKFLEAVDAYSRAIELDSSCAVYYGNRAAAYSKLNEHDSAIKDCEMALAKDSNYTKAFGRMGYAYASLGNHAKAVECYEKAVEADPSNQGYQQNLETARQKLRENGGHSSGGGMGGPGGFDIMGLLNNPNMMSMASQMMSSPHMQQMMGQFMGGGMPGGQGGGIPGEVPPTSNTTDSSSQQQQPAPPADMNELLRMGQQFASQMQLQNPELIANLRNQFQQQQDSSNNSSGGGGSQNDEPPPDYIS